MDISFQNFPFLQSIDTSFTLSRILDNEYLYDLKMLRSLQMSGCKITSKNLTKLNKLTTLRNLNLSFNMIEYLNKRMFYGLDSLVVLDLKTNQIKYIEDDTFYNFAFFTFDLSNNFIDNIKYLKEAQLKTLNLRKHYVKLIDDIDEPILKCRELDLAFNQIKNASLKEIII